MTRLIILSKEEIVSFESPPRFTAQERKYYFALPDWAEKLVATLTTPVSKTGFVLQLGYFRATNKFFPKSLFSPEDVAFVQKRLGITAIWQVSAYAETTMLRHRTLLLVKLGFCDYYP